VLPVAVELRRARVPIPAIATFLIAAPMLNPWSIIYGFTAMAPGHWAVLLATVSIIGIGAGLLAGRGRACAARASRTAAVDRWAARPVLATAVGAERMRAVAQAAGRELVSPILIDVAIGLVGVGLSSALLEAGTIETLVCGHRWADYLALSGLMPVVYIQSETAVMLTGDVLRIGSMPAAGVAILMLGAGLGGASLCWLWRNAGARWTARWLVLLASLVVGLGWMAQSFMGPCPLGTQDTHAFDFLTRPYQPIQGTFEVPAAIARNLVERLDAAKTVSLMGLVALAAAHVLTRDHRQPQEALRGPRVEAPSPVGILNRPLSRRGICLMVTGAVIGSVVFGLYVYYPPPADIVEDMDRVHSDLFMAIRTDRQDTALRKLERLQALSERLSIAAVIRGGRTQRQADAQAAFIESLRALRDAVQANNHPTASAWAITSTHRLVACRAAYQKEPA
jgi:uncharacterized membrane protein YraQ (UPF0718 family)